MNWVCHPNRPAERKRRLKLGLLQSRAIEELLAIFSASTFYRWRREASRGKSRRPKAHGKIQVLRDLVIKIAHETGFGLTKILGDLRRLCVSAQLECPDRASGPNYKTRVARLSHYAESRSAGGGVIKSLHLSAA